MAAAGDKTEAPTPRRLAEARRQGRVASSRDLSAAVVFVAVVGATVLGASNWVTALGAYLRGALSGALSGQTPSVAGQRALEAATAAAVPPLLCAVVAAVGIGVVQTKGLISWSALGLDPTRVLPKPSRVVSAAAGAEMVKGLLKVLAAAAVVWWTAAPLVRPVANLSGTSARGVLVAAGKIAALFAGRLAVVMVVLGIVDYLWQRHRLGQSLRMTREEVKREYKEAEGDPQHKAERQRLHRALLEQRMLADVRKADFVVVNPDHIAVAVRYDAETQTAPVVVAKGERLLAEAIKQVAREYGVPIFRDVNLARSLRDVEEGDEIPEVLYEAVAEILRVLGDPVGTRPAAPVGAPEAEAARAASVSFWKRA